jgi:hypothetical protein
MNTREKIKNFHVIVCSDLNEDKLHKLLRILKIYMKLTGYSCADMIGINPGICTHGIYLEEGSKRTREHQRRLKPTLKEVVNKEIMKLMSTKNNYPISDSERVIPIHSRSVCTRGH